MTKQIAIQLACQHYDYKWPKSLPSGVMYYHGFEITIAEFNKTARQFR